LCASASAYAGIINSGSGATLSYGYHTGAGGGLDVNTAHYWALDESGTPFADTGSSTFPIPMNNQSGTASTSSVLFVAGGATNNSRIIGTTGAGSQRISALTPTTNNLNDNITLDQANSYFGADGSISVDLLIRTDFDSTFTSGSGMRIISQENDEGNTQNLFVGYSPNIDNLGHRVEFAMGGAAAAIPVPTTGPHALENGSWYHVAATYNGAENTPGNVRMYWTRVNGPTDTTEAANEIQVTDASMSGGPFYFVADPVILATRPEFTFGNETNGTINKSFDGVFDAIRISTVARGPQEFIFVPEPASLAAIGVACILFVRRLRRNRS
jgi:hypothetical protein